MGDIRTTTRSASRAQRGVGATIAVAVLVGTLAGLATAQAVDAEPVAQAATTTGVASGGSIVHLRGNDIWLTSPDGATHQQVTTDGNTDTADFTGHAGYLSPSQSESGNVIVAVRNEGRTDDPFRKDGYIWVMNRQGQVIRKLKPPQWPRQGAPGCHELRVSPRGIIDAVVSPDGTKVAYVAVAEFDSPGCTRLVNHNQVRVVNIDGTNPHDLETTADGTGDPANPSWLSNSRLLLNGPGNEVYFVDLPAILATRWELLGREPEMKAGKLVGHGWSTEGTYNMYVFTAAGPPAAPVFRCHYANATGGFFASPSWAPDGTGLVWTESDGDVNEAGEGLWIMGVGDLASGCPAANARQLVVPGGRSPHWGPAPVGTPAFAVNDVTVAEGNSGTRTATFTVSRTSGVGTASVSWATANGTATAGSDFVGVAATPVTFDHLQTTKSVSVTVNGDATIEAHETFYVKLTAPSPGYVIADNTGRGTITNDDASAFSVNDLSVTEGHSGNKMANFTISRTAVDTAVSVAWFTANGTAVAGSDYVAVGATRVNFAAGEPSKPAAVPIVGDTTVENAETFFVKLTAPSAGTTIADGVGRGIVTNDDLATLTVNDVSVAEGTSGPSKVTLTITRSSGIGTASVNWSTVNGTALDGEDYAGVTATPANFAVGQTSVSVSVTVWGDWLVEPNETFFIKLTAPRQATIADGTGKVTVVNDDTGTP